MNAAKVAMFVLILNSVLGLFSEMNLLGLSFPHESWDLESEYKTEDWKATTIITDAASLLGLGEVARALMLFVAVLSKSLLIVPALMSNYGVPESLVVLITAIHYFVYLIGFAEFARGMTIG